MVDWRLVRLSLLSYCFWNTVSLNCEANDVSKNVPRRFGFCFGCSLSYIYRSYLRDRFRCDVERLNELLTSKQVKKVLFRVAKWRGELGDRMNRVLRNMGNLSIE